MSKSDTKPDAKKIYRRTFWITFLSLSFFFAFVLIAVDQIFLGGKGGLSGLAGGMTLPASILASSYATLVCHRAGVSQHRVEVETLRLAPNAATLDHAALPSYELNSRGVWGAMAILCGGCGALILPAVVFLPSKPGTAIYGYLLSGFFLLCGALFGLAYWKGLGFLAKVDALGVHGYNGASFFPKAVPWEEIASCEVNHTRDALGNESLPLFTFKSAEGNILLRFIVTGVEPGELFRFYDAVRAHFGVQPPTES